jgi:hypothetical protein
MTHGTIVVVDLSAVNRSITKTRTQIHRMAICVIILVFSFSFLTRAQALFQQDDAPIAPITGRLALTQSSSLAWSEGQNSFQMWKVEIAAAGAKTQWAKLKIPDELANFHNPPASRGERSVSVGLSDDRVLHILWLVDDCKQDTLVCTDTLYHAESHNDGLTWQLFNSRLATDFALSIVEQFAMVDSRHGWSMLTTGSQMNQINQMLVATADGGRTWETVAPTGDRSDKNKFLIMHDPVGLAGPRLLIAQSPTLVSFVAKSGEDNHGDYVFTAVHTDDAGHTWTTSKLSQAWPWCPGCVIEKFEVTANVRAHSRDVCFTAILRGQHEANPSSNLSSQNLTFYEDARYCSGDGGRTWSSPSRVTSPDSAMWRNAGLSQQALNAHHSDETEHGSKKPDDHIVEQELRVISSFDARTPPDPQSKLAFSDTDRLYAFGNTRAILYVPGSLIIQQPSAADASAMLMANTVNLDHDTQVLSVTSDGREAILSVGASASHAHLVHLDVVTDQRQDIPSTWYDSMDSETPAALSDDGRLISIYSESGPAESPMTVSVYDWPTKSLVAKRTSEYLAAGGAFNGGVTVDGAVEFVSSRGRRKIVDLKTGRLIGWFGLDSVRSPDGAWAVDFPNLSWDESAPKEVLLKDGANGQIRGKLNLDLPVADDEIYGSMGGAFCGTTGRFVLARARSVALYAVPSGKLLVSFPEASWRDANADTSDQIPVACSPDGTRVAILSVARLSFHDLK